MQSQQDYEAALGRAATGCHYVLIKVSGATTEPPREICIFAARLLQAIRMEHRREAGGRMWEAADIAYASAAQAFRFERPDALERVMAAYPAAVLAEMRAVLALLSDEQLREGFAEDGPLHYLYTSRADGLFESYRDAAAHLLIERGFTCGCGGNDRLLRAVQPGPRNEAVSGRVEVYESGYDNPLVVIRPDRLLVFNPDNRQPDGPDFDFLLLGEKMLKGCIVEGRGDIGLELRGACLGTMATFRGVAAAGTGSVSYPIEAMSVAIGFAADHTAFNLRGSFGPLLQRTNFHQAEYAPCLRFDISFTITDEQMRAVCNDASGCLTKLRDAYVFGMHADCSPASESTAGAL